jgi:hypothetical protein
MKLRHLFFHGSTRCRLSAWIGLISVLLLTLFVSSVHSVFPNPQASRNMGPHGAIGIACSNCHEQGSWKPIRRFPDFDHKTTRFPLQGMHAKAYCRDCHVRLIFSSAGSACVDCHADIHRRQLGGNCEQCHSARGWRVSPMSVNGHENRFPLLGAHATLQCESCHKGAAVSQFRGLNTDCSFCHISEFNAAKTINHKTAGFSVRCELCHSSDTWLRGFNHALSTGFPLTGAHAQQDCAQCHPGYKFAGTAANCVDCHLQKFIQAANPNHVTSNFPQNCSICHSTTAWTPAAFDHSKSSFTLTGAHRTVACTSCHIAGVYAGTPTDCYSCHSKEFNSTSNPNHVGAGFGKDCSQCHSTSTWSGAVFSHTRFPIYSGSHAGKWSACSDCHANSSNFSSFTCVTCHEHSKTTVDSKHRGVSNYVYNSANCYACHPNGRAD